VKNSKIHIADLLRQLAMLVCNLPNPSHPWQNQINFAPLLLGEQKPRSHYFMLESYKRDYLILPNDPKSQLCHFDAGEIKTNKAMHVI
jgi:hypothetical protein